MSKYNTYGNSTMPRDYERYKKGSKIKPEECNSHANYHIPNTNITVNVCERLLRSTQKCSEQIEKISKEDQLVFLCFKTNDIETLQLVRDSGLIRR
jgi:hypothetical protein